MMDWNELRSGWQARGDRNEAAAEISLELRSHAQQTLWRRVKWRDGLETVVALLLAPGFAFTAWWLAQAGLWWPAGFAAALVIAIVYIPIRLWRARRRIPVLDPGVPVIEFLRAERSALQAQAAMLSSVARWYSGPICVGVVGFYTSLKGPTVDSLIYALFVLGLFLAIEFGNRLAVRKRFEPAIDTLDHQISLLEQES